LDEKKVAYTFVFQKRKKQKKQEEGIAKEEGGPGRFGGGCGVLY